MMSALMLISALLSVEEMPPGVFRSAGVGRGSDERAFVMHGQKPG